MEEMDGIVTSGAIWLYSIKLARDTIKRLKLWYADCNFLSTERKKDHIHHVKGKIYLYICLHNHTANERVYFSAAQQSELNVDLL